MFESAHAGRSWLEGGVGGGKEEVFEKKKLHSPMTWGGGGGEVLVVLRKKALAKKIHGVERWRGSVSKSAALEFHGWRGGVGTKRLSQKAMLGGEVVFEKYCNFFQWWRGGAGSKSRKSTPHGVERSVVFKNTP